MLGVAFDATLAHASPNESRPNAEPWPHESDWAGKPHVVKLHHVVQHPHTRHRNRHRHTTRVHIVSARSMRKSAAFHCRHCLQVSHRGVDMRRPVLRTSSEEILPVQREEAVQAEKGVRPEARIESTLSHSLSPDYGGWFGSERTVASAAQGSSVEQVIATNVATADQIDGAAKLMLLIAAAPASVPHEVAGSDASSFEGDAIASEKY